MNASINKKIIYGINIPIIRTRNTGCSRKNAPIREAKKNETKYEMKFVLFLSKNNMMSFKNIQY